MKKKPWLEVSDATWVVPDDSNSHGVGLIGYDLTGDGASDALLIEWDESLPDRRGFIRILPGPLGTDGFGQPLEIYFKLVEERSPYLLGLSEPADLNGDGYLDLLVFANSVGKVLLGGRTETNERDSLFLIPGPITDDVSAEPFRYAEKKAGLAHRHFAFFGSPGDTDGDGVSEVVIPSKEFLGKEGERFVSVLPLPLASIEFLHDAPVLLTVGASLDDRGGIGALGAFNDCDVNGDGLDDVIVWSSYSNEPAAWVLLGPIGARTSLTQADATIHGVYPYDYQPFSCAGDTDGDGRDEVLVTAGKEERQFDRVLVALLRGPWSGELTVQESMPLSGVEGHFVSATPGGDLDGDGLDDIVVISNDQGRHWLTAHPGVRRGVAPLPLFRIDLEVNTYRRLAVSLGDIDGDNRPDLFVFRLPVPARSGGTGFQRGDLLIYTNATLRELGAFVER